MSESLKQTDAAASVMFFDGAYLCLKGLLIVSTVKPCLWSAVNFCQENKGMYCVIVPELPSLRPQTATNGPGPLRFHATATYVKMVLVRATVTTEL